jgi:hypothetical protein
MSIPNLVLGRIALYDPRVSSVLSRVNKNIFIEPKTPEEKFNAIVFILLRRILDEIQIAYRYIGEHDSISLEMGEDTPISDVIPLLDYVLDGTADLARNGPVTLIFIQQSEMYIEALLNGNIITYSAFMDRFYALVFKRAILSDVEMIRYTIKQLLTIFYYEKSISDIPQISKVFLEYIISLTTVDGQFNLKQFKRSIKELISKDIMDTGRYFTLQMLSIALENLADNNDLIKIFYTSPGADYDLISSFNRTILTVLSTISSQMTKDQIFGSEHTSDNKFADIQGYLSTMKECYASLESGNREAIFY